MRKWISLFLFPQDKRDKSLKGPSILNIKLDRLHNTPKGKHKNGKCPLNIGINTATTRQNTTEKNWTFKGRGRLHTQNMKGILESKQFCEKSIKYYTKQFTADH